MEKNIFLREREKASTRVDRGVDTWHHELPVDFCATLLFLKWKVFRMLGRSLNGQHVGQVMVPMADFNALTLLRITRGRCEH